MVLRDVDGTHWHITCRTTDKDVTATACLDFVLAPYPDTSEHDGGQP